MDEDPFQHQRNPDQPDADLCGSVGLSYLVHVLKTRKARIFPVKVISRPALLPILIDETRLNVGWLLALFVVVLGWILMSRHIIGFQIKVIGMAPMAGAFAGFKENRLIWITLLISGGCAGLAGVIELSGAIGQIVPSISPGYGFTAIIVAFLGRLHPVGVLFAGSMALTYLAAMPRS